MTVSSKRFWHATQLILCFAPAIAAWGQVVAPTDTSRKHQTLFTSGDALLAGGFAVATVAMFPADRYVARHLRDQTSPANRFLDRSAKGLEFISTPGSFIIGGTMYAAGRLTGHPGLADLGLHGTEAVLVGSGITSLLKGALGRSRPYVTADTNPRDFRLGSGYGNGDRVSFPSGHATSAFAAAAAVTSEMHRLWPRYTTITGVAMYGGASLVALSRMYHNQHWASDVVLGAAIGTFSGLKVVRYSHAHPDNFIDRMLLSTIVVPATNGGGVLSFSVPLPH